MTLQGMKVLYLVAADFEDLEFWVPIMRLQEEAAQVVIAGLSAQETFQGKYGIPATSQIGFEAVDPKDYDAVLIPGGWAPDKLRRYTPVKRIVRSMYDQAKTVGMICHAGLVGISAGIVSGHQATGSEGIKDDLINAGAVWRDEPAFRSGNIVWGRVVKDIPDYCRKLIVALQEQRARG